MSAHPSARNDNKMTRRACALAAAGVAWLTGLTGAAPQAWAAMTPGAATSGAGGTLTCFAIDVSGSNLAAANGEPPSDPGPVFVRQQVVQLYDEVLPDLGAAAGQQVGVVTFGTHVGAELGPVALSDAGGRSRLEAALPAALRPSPAEAAWTSWVAGVDGCGQMFQRSRATHGMVAVLTDGHPQGPSGGPGQQLAALSPTARSLSARGITIQPVLYGAGADRPGPARQAMSRLASLGGGQFVPAATPLSMLSSALHLASLATGLPLGGREVPVDGDSSVPLKLPGQVAIGVLIALRSSDRVPVSLGAPGGQTIATLPAGAGGPGLVHVITRPAAGIYQASAQGQGSLYAAELLRTDGVQVPSLHSGSHRPVAAPRRGGVPGWGFVAALSLGALAMILAAWLTVSRRRRRPKGALVVWLGKRWCCVDPIEAHEPLELADLFPAAGCPAGWAICWNRRAPLVAAAVGPAVRLEAGQTRAVDTQPPVTFTWLPDGIDTSLSGEPPGRPIWVATDPMPTIDRTDHHAI
ncbi:MAG TPA: vWA domain-containing protein [Streptosporangiaceae bacterium]